MSEEDKKDEEGKPADEADDAKNDDADAKAADDANDDEGHEPEDEGTPDVEAIAKRVAALGADDEVERIAREEEQKLAERRRKLRGGKGRTGLEAAASKRLAKIGTKARPTKRAVPAAVEAADPLIERTQRLSEWVKKNRNLVQGAVVVAVLGLIGGGIYAYLDHKKTLEASVALAQAVADERGMIGDPDKAEDDEVPHEKTPIFRTPDDRQNAALAKYREVETHYHGTGAAWLARLGEGALLLDKRDPDGAIAAFNDVASSSLAKADPEVRGRSLENLGFAYELKAQMHPDERDKDLALAIDQYKQIESADIFGMKQMAIYHQARCFEATGDKAKAMELLKGLRDELMKDPSDGHLFDELKSLTDDRLRRLDPTAVPARRRGNVGAGGNISPELLEKLPPELREKLMHQAGGGGGMPE